MADKALLFGINNYLSVSRLRGCVRDVESMRELLTEVFGFDPSNVRTLKDDQAVKDEIRERMDWLFQDVGEGDRVVLHFSGHGSYTADLDGDEDDGRDDLICLYDMDFDDPGTYFLDDELRAWSRTKPEGVRLTVVLDCCHSGTGTRMLVASAPGRETREVEIDPETALRRSAARSAITRVAVGEEAPRLSAAIAAVADPESDDFVRVRFVEPPPAIKDKIVESRRKRRKTRGAVKVEGLNHVLLSACRDDQTAADATIDGEPSGAFTHYLCATLRAGGANLERRALIDRVALALSAGRFSQEPQLEGDDDRGPLFGLAVDPGGAKNETEAAAPIAAPQPTRPLDVETLTRLAEKLAGLAPDVQRRLLDLSWPATATEPKTIAPRAALPSVKPTRVLVYVHGICKHVAGFSNAWWDALHPYTTAFGAGNLGKTRREVVWSDIVNARALAARVSADPMADDRARLAEEIRETLRDRIDRQAVQAAPQAALGEAPRPLADTRALIEIPWLNCVDDFTVYMVNDSTRAEILARFTEVVEPLLRDDVEVDLISHSWGTVVAYEGLRELAAAGLVKPLLGTFFTVGAALSIGPVKRALHPANRDGAKPAMVRRWVNLSAIGDPVGGPLQGRPYAVDNDFPYLAPYGCPSFLGIVNPVCAHSSYFTMGNVAVNRDIFGRFINLD